MKLKNNPLARLNNIHISCFTCGQKGHYASHCPEKVAQQTAQGGNSGPGGNNRNKSVQEREMEMYAQAERMQEEERAHEMRMRDQDY
jgi:hypothetical protein